jgi:hypothetical protein
MSPSRWSARKSVRTRNTKDVGKLEEIERHTIVTPHKRITVTTPQLAIDELACTLERNVHVAVHRLEFACSTKRNAMLANLRWSFPLTFA